MVGASSDVSNDEHAFQLLTRAREAIDVVTHFEPGLDAAPTMEVNQIMLQDIKGAKKVERCPCKEGVHVRQLPYKAVAI